MLLMLGLNEQDALPSDETLDMESSKSRDKRFCQLKVVAV